MPELQHRRDGSIWFRENRDEDWREVAPPGTDTREMRFAQRTLPVVELARKLVDEVEPRPARPDEITPELEHALDRLIDEADADDHILVEAAWFLERSGHDDDEEALIGAAELLEVARTRLRWRDLPEDVRELWSDATVRWQSAHGE